MDTVTSAPSLEASVDIGYLDLGRARFYKTSGGFTGLKYGEADYPRISLRRALPIEKPSEYISVADSENKEIGILRSLQELSDEQLPIVVDELDKRYYCPQIREIKSVKDKLGYVYMELSLVASDKVYEKNCAIKDVNKNIRVLDERRLLIFDVDGNRYIIPALAELDKKSIKRLGPYMF